MNRELALSFVLPICWAFTVAAHMVFFSIEPGGGFIAMLFDKMVMLSCFLLYPLHEFVGDDPLHSIVPFAAQFMFWWAFSYSMIKAVKKFKRTI